MPSPECVVVELVGDSLVSSILYRYAHSLGAAGSQLAAVGVGHGSTAALGAVATVAQKLARTPTVERTLWLESAVDVVRNTIDPALAKGREPELSCERREVIDCLFEFARSTRRRGRSSVYEFDAGAMAREQQRLERTPVYRDEWALLVVEFSACMDPARGDPAFAAWATGKG